ncbi:MAG: RNA polymerase sigma factor [Desulfitobacterium sp.]
MSKTMNPIDQEIIELYNQGNREEALRKFTGEYQRKLYNLAYQMLGNHDDALDALQEILIQVNRSLSSFKGTSSLYTWAYRLSTNVCLNFRKKRTPSSKQVEWDENILQSLMQPIERPNEDPDKMCETKYKQFLVQQALLKLPESQRMIVVLHDLEGISSPEIGRILDINANAVKSRLYRARAALRNIISQGFEVQGMEGVGAFTVGPSGKLI